MAMVQFITRGKEMKDKELITEFTLELDNRTRQMIADLIDVFGEDATSIIKRSIGMAWLYKEYLIKNDSEDEDITYN